MRKKTHPKTLSSQNTFVQKHFHPKTLSSKNTFVQNHFIQNHFHQRQKRISSTTLSSKNGFIQLHFHPKMVSSNDIFVQMVLWVIRGLWASGARSLGGAGRGGLWPLVLGDQVLLELPGQGQGAFRVASDAETRRAGLATSLGFPTLHSSTFRGNVFA